MKRGKKFVSRVLESPNAEKTSLTRSVDRSTSLKTDVRHGQRWNSIDFGDFVSRKFALASRWTCIPLVVTSLELSRSFSYGFSRLLIGTANILRSSTLVSLHLLLHNSSGNEKQGGAKGSASLHMRIEIQDSVSVRLLEYIRPYSTSWWWLASIGPFLLFTIHKCAISVRQCIQWFVTNLSLILCYEMGFSGSIVVVSFGIGQRRVPLQFSLV